MKESHPFVKKYVSRVATSLLVTIILFLAGCTTQEINRPASTREIPVTTTQMGNVGTVSVSDNVTVHFIYVDIGDAIFVDTNGKDMLIDAGCRECGQVVLDYLSRINASKIDIIVASHHDEDHIGGLTSILSAPYTLDVWDSGSTRTSQVYQDYGSLATTKNFTIVERGQIYWLNNNTKVTVLNPNQPLEFDKENDNSVVLKIEFGDVSFLFAGDCEVECENSVLASGLNVSAVILKAGHHCSRTSTSNDFLDSVNPKIAICSVGASGNARFGHPHLETINRLKAKNVEVYTTLDSGDIKIRTDGKDFSVLSGD